MIHHQHDTTTAAAARALLTEISLMANGGPVTSVLICDDRPAVVQGLSEMLEPLPSMNAVVSVRDGFALVDAYTAKPADLVLLGIDRENSDGEVALGLLLGMNRSAVIVVVGSVADIDRLTAVYSQGARGLLLWEPDQESRPEAHPDGPLVW